MPPSANSAAPIRFAELGVAPALCAALETSGFTAALPVQVATLPDCLAGRDVCGMAPTGSGKTLAFGLAALSRLATAPRPEPGGRRRRPSALILVPTRELAAQVAEVLAPLGSGIGARTVAVYGGVGYDKQLTALRKGADVVVACPGRLLDLVSRGWANLSEVDLVVVDEADRMADMGFLPTVRRLLEMTSPARQTLLFSATLVGPVDTLIRDHQRNPVHHEVGVAADQRGRIHHHFWRVESHDRAAVTAEAIIARGPALVFCRTKRGADRLSGRFTQSGLESAAIHGNRSQGQRERALSAFRAGRLDVLVATDVAARGIHVDAVPLVVHFDPPADATNYVHRSGRTGRAGADGLVLSLIGSEHLDATRSIQRKLALPSKIGAPDVRSLATVESGRRAPKAAVPGSARANRQPGGKTPAGARPSRRSSRRQVGRH